MDKLEIVSCRQGIGEEWCPVEYDGHCMLGSSKVETTADGIPHNCPLKKSPVILLLKAEAILINTEPLKRFR